MKEEEEFDQLIRERINSLNFIPDVEWNEEKVWKKIKSGKNFNFNLFTYGVILIVTTLLVTLFSLPEIPVTLEQNKLRFEPAKQIDPDASTVSKAEPVREKQEDLSRELIKIKKIDPKREKTIQDLISQKLSSPEDNVTLKTEHAMEKKDSVKEAPPIRLNSPKAKNSQEIVLSAGSHSFNLGLNRITYASPRISLAYGIHLRQFNSSPGVFENGASLSNILFLEIPFQVRYQFPSRESRFSIILYSELQSSLIMNQSAGVQNYSLKYTLGTELRYRFYQGNNRAAYFFVRLPVYGRNLVNKGYQNSTFNLMPR
jgi:hypothetical protein